MKGREKISAQLTKAHLIFWDYREEAVDFYLGLNLPWQVADAFAWQLGVQILVRQLLLLL